MDGRTGGTPNLAPGSLDAVLIISLRCCNCTICRRTDAPKSEREATRFETCRLDHMCPRRARCPSVIGTVLSSLSSLDGRADWC